MSALDVVNRLSYNLKQANFKYCLVNEKKLPIKIDGSLARPNHTEDFVDLDEILQLDKSILETYAGLGISIQASMITAIDVDKCFSVPFDITSASEMVLDIIEMFMNFAYIEFSFSGTGLRILYRQPEVSNYTNDFYTKSERFGIEYYQPTASFRYVTLTGHTLVDNDIDSEQTFSDTILDFLNKYMKRQSKVIRSSVKITEETRSFSELFILVRKFYMKNIEFQDRWFDTAHYMCNVPGKSHESHDDYHLMNLLFENITTDKEMVKQLFEASPYFKSKDFKHMQKWTRNDCRYFYFIFDEMLKKKGLSK